MGCDGIKTLESKHMLSILLFLLENGNITKMDLYNAVSKNPRMPEKLEELVDLGLITVDIEERTCYVDLTSKGREVAEHVKAIAILSDDRNHHTNTPISENEFPIHVQNPM